MAGPKVFDCPSCGPLLLLAIVALAVYVSQVGFAKTVSQAASLAGMTGLKGVPVSRPLSAGLPRTSRYADLDFTVVST
jgi:hypothetical protein